MAGVKPVTVVTGASSGIGAELARVFAAKGHDLVLVARREERLRKLAAELERDGKQPLVLPFDLARMDSVARLGHEITKRRLEVSAVVNCAGFGLHGSGAELDRGEQTAMVDLNVRALTDLSLRFVDNLAKHKGGVLNVASVASFLPGPGMAVYYASKAYVLSFSEALRAELAPLGVRVTTLCPGPVPTEFQARATMDERPFSNLITHSAEYVAKIGYQGFMRGDRVVIPGVGNKVVTFLPRILPRGLVLSLMNRALRRRKTAAPVEQPAWPNLRR